MKSNNLSAIGENGLIAILAGQFGTRFEDGTVGIGDDCAVLPIDSESSLLVTTDMLIENTHFLYPGISASDLGYKSLAVNLSDIAAMGGIPGSAFLSIGLPSHINSDWVKDFGEGFRELAKKWDIKVLGGDTVRSALGIVVNVTVIGTAHPARIKFRSKTRVGDIIAVTDTLGDSAAGLKIILNKVKAGIETDRLLARHYRPRTYLDEGQWLGAQTEVHSMMDVSDGVYTDIHHITSRSKCGAEIYLDQLPLSPDLQNACTLLNCDAVELAATGGEDYCLMVTMDESKFASIQKNYLERFGSHLYAIGRATPENQKIRFLKQGQAWSGEHLAFTHF